MPHLVGKVILHGFLWPFTLKLHFQYGRRRPSSILMVRLVKIQTPDCSQLIHKSSYLWYNFNSGLGSFQHNTAKSEAYLTMPYRRWRARYMHWHSLQNVHATWVSRQTLETSGEISWGHRQLVVANDNAFPPCAHIFLYRQFCRQSCGN